ncbi:D-alanyl-D-alanine carboxypeptidase family protein [Pelagibacterium montanilacus]|uniref:D-alanyl-D-alanine carboxypeptidase family protein n=1 Tax=Pelagibacterium montanilacus TaxID=2185280 RepID=UPI000F8CD572|nr:D-alanyl-D-alanine carboxypeptidase family protein [Pelagibacterium montanilacus]
MVAVRPLFSSLVLAFALWLGAIAAAFSQAEFETSAPYALLMDHASGTVLYQRDADALFHPASMAKLMTVAVVLDMVQSGELSLDDEFIISEHAWRTGGAPSTGSTMFAELGSMVRVEDLLKSVVIQSGNDASIALAEGIAGNEAVFASMMNEFADRIGMENSNFTNPSGLPNEDMVSTARDIVTLARYIINEFPEYYPWFGETSFTWNNITQSNRNALIGQLGIDGLKTGHLGEAGYGIVVSGQQGDRRLIGLVHGLETESSRTEAARQLMTWGTRAFERVAAFADGDVVGEVRVYGGERSHVAVSGEGPIDLYLPRGSRRCISANIVYQAPISPPVEQGQLLAELNILCDDRLIQTAPLYAAEFVGQGDLTRRAADALVELTLGWL